MMQGWFNICRSIIETSHINKFKDKNYVIVSIDEEKAYDKVKHPFTKKHFQEIGIEGLYLNIIKVLNDKPTGNINNGEKLRTSPLRKEIRNGCPFSSLLSNIVVEALATAIAQGK